jgi:hypothetical protein
MGQQTKTNFFDPTGQAKPLEVVQKQKPNLVNQIWLSRAQRVLKTLDHVKMVLAFLEEASMVAAKLQLYMQ